MGTEEVTIEVAYEAVLKSLQELVTRRIDVVRSTGQGSFYGSDFRYGRAMEALELAKAFNEHQRGKKTVDPKVWPDSVCSQGSKQR